MKLGWESGEKLMDIYVMIVPLRWKGQFCKMTVRHALLTVVWNVGQRWIKKLKYIRVRSKAEMLEIFKRIELGNLYMGGTYGHVQ